ncbi:MAG: hypothetical protein PVI88_00255 [Nitrosopumilaceae archaeon]|jgi:hypothetical protein
MEEQKELIIDGIKFQLYPLNVMTALKLDKKVVSLLLPVLSGVDDFDLDAEIDLGKAMSAFSTSLANMKDEDFISFVKEMLSTIVVEVPGQAPTQIQSESEINTVFKGSIVTIYKLLWEVMKFNNFSPFVVADGGTGMIQTIISRKAGQQKMQSGKGSAK